MKKIYPKKLQKGDEIRVIAPARSMSIISSENMHKQMKVIPTVDTTLLCGVLDFSGKKNYLDFIFTFTFS